MTNETARDLPTRMVKTYGVCRHLDEKDSEACKVCVLGPRTSTYIEVSDERTRGGNHLTVYDASTLEEAYRPPPTNNKWLGDTPEERAKRMERAAQDPRVWVFIAFGFGSIIHIVGAALGYWAL